MEVIRKTIRLNATRGYIACEYAIELVKRIAKFCNVNVDTVVKNIYLVDYTRYRVKLTILVDGTQVDVKNFKKAIRKA